MAEKAETKKDKDIYTRDSREQNNTAPQVIILLLWQVFQFFKLLMILGGGGLWVMTSEVCKLLVYNHFMRLKITSQILLSVTYQCSLLFGGVNIISYINVIKS